VSFANPLMLMGLLAAAVPILIHLIHQNVILKINVKNQSK
jgi:hypothetical protein